MNRVALRELDSTDLREGTVRRVLTEPLGTDAVALNHYRVDPDGGLPGGLHAHRDQEEVFVVLSGTAVFETLADAVVVEAGEAVRFAPGEYQTGRNAGDDPLELLALGVPKVTEDVRLPVDCPVCDHSNVRLATDGDGVRFVCPDCETVRVPEPCPDCGRDALAVVPGTERRTAVRCGECGAEYDRAPVTPPD